jgi:hypothetical protein
VSSVAPTVVITMTSLSSSLVVMPSYNSSCVLTLQRPQVTVSIQTKTMVCVFLFVLVFPYTFWLRVR